MQVAVVAWAVALCLASCGPSEQGSVGQQDPQGGASVPNQLEDVKAPNAPRREDEGVPSSAVSAPISVLARRQRSGEVQSFVARVTHYGPTAGRRLRGGMGAPEFAVELEIELPKELAGEKLRLRSQRDLPEGDPLKTVGGRHRLSLRPEFVDMLAATEEGHTIMPGVGAVEVLGPAATE